MVYRNHFLLVSLLVFILQGKFFAQTDQFKINPSFKHISIKEGLSQGYISSIVQDDQGFIWVGTWDGLNRYDGYNFKIFKHNLNDSTSISADRIMTQLITKDGTHWVGTDNGKINKYNSKTDSFSSFSINPTNNSANEITTLIEHSSGLIWIGTNGGLFNFNPENKMFKEYVFSNEDDKKQLLVNTIVEDKSGNLLIGTVDPSGGLFYIDFEKNANYHFNEPSAKFDFTNNLSVNVIHVNNDGEYLIGTNNGLYSFNKLSWQRQLSGNSKRQFSFNEFTDRIFEPFQVHKIVEDDQANLWIGSFSFSGVQLIEHPYKEKLKFDIQANNKNRFKSVFVIASFVDRSGNIWLGTNGAGIYKYAKTKNKFAHLYQNNNSNFKISSKSIRGILEDSKNRIWIAGYGGLDVLDQKTGKSRFVGISGPGKPSDSLFVPTWLVYEDPVEGDDVFWIGTEGDGLYRYNYKNNLLDEHYYPIKSKYQDAKKFQKKTNSNHPYRLLRDRDYQFWMASSTGLEKFNGITRSFETVTLPEANCPIIPSIIVEPSNDDDHLWISTWECGLLLYNKRKDIFHHVLPKSNDPNSLSSRIIYTISEDQNMNLWIGTNNGISILNLKDFRYTAIDPVENLKFKNYSMNDGLANNHIYGILEGNNGEMWISSNKGLSSLNPKTGAIRNFDVNDGIQDLEFNRHSYAKGADGRLYFGGTNGVNYFYPDQIETNQNIPSLVFTNFRVLNKTYDLIDEKGVNMNISDVESITLNHDQNIISFEFAALEYTESIKNQYAYRLEGFDQDWIHIGNKREAYYTNLDPGKYTFRTKASNNDGIWNEEGKSLDLIINPPWWLNNWGKALWVCLILMAFYYTNKIISYRVRTNERLKMGEEQLLRLKELDQLKTNLFSNISHEFRTPLTLILNPLKSILPMVKKKELKQEMDMVLRNANRLLQLVNQILDLSKLESGKMKKITNTGDLVLCIKRLVSSFDSLADNYSIKFQKHYSVAKLVTDFNEDHIEKILNNIFSNAFKFTPEGGKVKFLFELLTVEDRVFIPMKDSREQISSCRIIISDTGIGINKKALPSIFDRFYQADNSSIRNFEGTGIGLSLVKELTELYGGKIAIKSETDWGTEVSITLPLENVYSLVDIEDTGILDTEEDKILDKSRLDLEKNEWIGESVRIKNNEENIILVVEDNKDLRSYIRSIIQSDFVVIEAVNGLEGWELAVNQIPDLIISDVMMPKMNGFELSKKLKQDHRTSHIPIILLTAISSKENKLSGLKIGVDEYLTKPFDKDELKVRIDNLIQNRSSLQAHFSSGNFMSTNPKLQAKESTFLKKAKGIVEENMGNDQFSVEDLSIELGMSRVQFHRKLKAITNQTTTHYIRSIRLEKAKELLNYNDYNITEVAYMVGFSSQSYFTKSFQKHFGMPPSVFSKTN